MFYIANWCDLLARRAGGVHKFVQANTFALHSIAQTDVVFIDALHVYATVLHEMKLGARAGAHTMLLHDTELHRDEGGCMSRETSCQEVAIDLGVPLSQVTRGLADAIAEFLSSSDGVDW